MVVAPPRTICDPAYPPKPEVASNLRHSLVQGQLLRLHLSPPRGHLHDGARTTVGLSCVGLSCCWCLRHKSPEFEQTRTAPRHSARGGSWLPAVNRQELRRDDDDLRPRLFELRRPFELRPMPLLVPLVVRFAIPRRLRTLELFFFGMNSHLPFSGRNGWTL